MKKEDQKIMVVERKKLYSNYYFEGFLHSSRFNFYQVILKNYIYKRRGDVELDESYKQPISYIIFFNKKKKLVFLYQRAEKKKDYTEKRLSGRWSIGIGGHIDLTDKKDNDPLIESAKREAAEEVGLDGNTLDIKLVGYINDEADSVGKVHFGVVFLAEVTEDIRPFAREIKTSKMVSVEDLNTISRDASYEIEGWSKILIDNLTKVLKRG